MQRSRQRSRGPDARMKSHAIPTVASMTTSAEREHPNPQAARTKRRDQPAITAAVCAAVSETSTGERRQRMPTQSRQTRNHRECNPEILTRWPMPLRLNKVHRRR